MPLVNIIDLCKKYKNNTVLNNINLKINKQDFIILLGQSGSGKTTLLNIISSIDVPTSGQILFEDKDITKMTLEESAKFRRNNISYIFQDYKLLPMLNVEENILLPLFLESKKIDSFYFDSLIDILEIKNLLHKEINFLSGGEQQRVAIARALINKPKLILADEPTGNLDYENGIKVLEIFKQLNQKFNSTIIMATHNQSYFNYANKIIRIKDGNIMYE